MPSLFYPLDIRFQKRLQYSGRILDVFKNVVRRNKNRTNVLLCGECGERIQLLNKPANERIIYLSANERTERNADYGYPN